MSLTSDDLGDIKQLMEATVAANNKVLLETINARFNEQDKKFNARFNEQDKKLDSIMDAVGVRFDEDETRIDDHEIRIVHLEKRAA